MSVIRLVGFTVAWASLCLSGCELLVDFARDKVDGSGGSGGALGSDSGMPNAGDDAGMPLDGAMDDEDAGSGALPTAVDDKYKLDVVWLNRVSAATGVLSNDLSYPGDMLTAELVTPPDAGTLTLMENGGFLFKILPSDLGDQETIDVTFTYVAKNANGTSAPGTVTITIDSNEPPSATPPTFVTAGNTTLTESAGALLAGVVDPEGKQLEVRPLDGPTTGGGRVVIAPDGSFVYTPAVGTLADDSFSFEVTDGTHKVLAQAIVHMGDDLIWYVDNAATRNGDGTSEAPFDNLAEAISAAATGDTLYVAAGDDIYPAIALKNDQRLVGAGVPLTHTVDNAEIVLRPADASPKFLDSGAVITLANSNRLAGLQIGDPSSSVAGANTGITGSGFTDADLRSITIFSPVVTGIDLSNVQGTVTGHDVRVEGSQSAALRISQSSASFTFDNLQAIDAHAGDQNPTVGMTPLPGGAVELNMLTGDFTWNGGRVMYSSGSSMPALLASAVSGMTLTGTAATPLDMGGAGASTTTGLPVPTIFVDQATFLHASHLTVHDQKGVGSSRTTAVGALYLLDVSDEITVADSKFGTVDGLGALGGHGIQVVSTAASKALTLSVTGCEFGGDVASSANLRDAVSVKFDGDSNGRMDITVSDNQLSAAETLLEFRSFGTTGQATPHAVVVEQNSSDNTTFRPLNFWSDGAPHSAITVRNNRFHADSTIPPDYGLYFVAPNASGSQTALTISSNTFEDFPRQVIALSAQSGPARITTLIDGNTMTYLGSDSSTFGQAVLVTARDSGRCDVTMTSNSIALPAGNAITLQSGQPSTPTTLCADIRSNEDGSGSAPGNINFDTSLGGLFESAQADDVALSAANAGASVVNFPAVANALCQTP